MGGFQISRDASAGMESVVRSVLPSVTTVQAGARGAGTGIVLSESGEVLTNHHVVTTRTGGPRGALRVGLLDGRELDARLIRTHPVYDLALLKVQATGLRPVSWGDSDRLRVGEMVFAIGNPWGEPGVVTAGIVSAVGKRAAPEGAQGAPNALIPYIRSDVALAPGNSGGPMLDALGRVVGINAMIWGGDLSVAIPAATARDWLAHGDEADGPRLGVGVQAVRVPGRGAPLTANAHGLMVIDVDPAGPAAQVLTVGDVVVAADNAATGSPDGLALAVRRAARTGNPLRLRILRAGELRSVQVRF